MLTSLALIFLFGLIFGALFQKLRLPPLLGMLIVGIVLGPYALNWLDDSLLSISADLRQIALIIILTRAGLNLNISDLKKVGRPAILMCFLPACFKIRLFPHSPGVFASGRGNVFARKRRQRINKKTGLCKQSCFCSVNFTVS